MSVRTHSAAQVGLLVVALSTIVAACGAGAAPSPTPGEVGTGLHGRTFLSTAVTVGGKPFELAPGTRVRLAFQAGEAGQGGDATGNLSASAGCNTIGGQYRIDGGRLIFSGGAMTEMACPGARGAQDGWLVTILAAGPALTVDGNTVTLATGAPSDTTITLLDEAVAQPDQPLAGPSWIVTGVLTGDVASSVPAGIFATLTFQPDGTLQVATGCNTGSAAWAVSDDHLQVTDLALTKKACAPPLGPFETQLVEILRSSQLTYVIDGFSMTLLSGSAGSSGSSGVQLQAPGLD